MLPYQKAIALDKKAQSTDELERTLFDKGQISNKGQWVHNDFYETK